MAEPEKDKTPSPAEITKSVEESEKFVTLIAEAIRSSNWVRLVLILGTLFEVVSVSYRLLTGNPLTVKYWIFSLSIQ